MKVFLTYAQGKDRIELFANGTGAAMIDGEFYPISKEDFDFFKDLNNLYGDAFDMASYFKCFGKTFDALCEAERIENDCRE